MICPVDIEEYATDSVQLCKPDQTVSDIERVALMKCRRILKYGKNKINTLKALQVPTYFILFDSNFEYART